MREIRRSPYQQGRDDERALMNARPMTIINVSQDCYAEIRERLVAAGTGGVIEERADQRKITMGDVCIVTVGLLRPA